MKHKYFIWNAVFLIMVLLSGSIAAAEETNSIPSIWESNPMFAINLILMFFSGVATTIIISNFLIHKRKRKEELISEAKAGEVKERLERIINTAPIAYMLYIDGKVVDLNEHIKRATGLKVGDDVSKIHAAPEHHEQIVKKVARENAVTDEIIKIKLVNGEVHRCITNVSTVEYDQKIATVVWAVDIEENEKYKDRLQDTQRDLQALLDVLPVSLRITDRETASILYANNTCLKMFGYDTPEEMYKHSLYDIVSPIQTDGVLFREKIHSLLYADEPMSMDVEYLHAEGNIIDTQVITCNIGYNGRQSTLALITDLAKIKEAQRIRQNLQTVLDMLPVAVRIIDNKTKLLTYTNKAVAEMFGAASPESEVGKPESAFIPETQPDGTTTADILNKVNLTPKPITTEITLRKTSGELFEALLTTYLIDYNGAESSLGIVQDLTAEKEHQAMLANTIQKEKEANLLKSRFLVNMSHEIRTPMNVIIGLTEIELHKDLPEDHKDIYKKVNTSAKNLLAIINDILDLSKIEADKIELYDEEFEMEEVLNSALLVASPRLDGKNVEFILNQALDLPRFLMGDKTRLWQILKNFLDNSAKYTDNGKIVLTVLTDSEQSDDKTVNIKFTVEDTGVGMTDEQIKHIFTPYEQVYNDAQKKYTGTGLGMTISKQLCELMGGTLQLESRLGIGTIVHLSIPFRRSPNNETAMQLIKSQALAGINVLAVDDDKLSLDIMERLLKNSSANYTTAVSGMEAMEIILQRRNNNEEPFDIILLDYMMDGLNGLETARQIQLALSNAPKLLMVTAYQRLLVKRELEKYGIHGSIEKPFIPSHFINKICAAMELESGVPEEITEIYTKFKNVRVLLCEDYRLNQEVAAGMLSQFGVETIIAKNGSLGIEALNSGTEFDLIFMDLQMPVMDGYEVTRIIRADPRFDDIPIISLTADAMKNVVDECMEMGMNDHIAKPIEFDSLHKILQKWLPESKRVPNDEVIKPASDPFNEALVRFGGNMEQYKKALLEFSEMLPNEWQSFDDALKDIEKTKQYIHKLKGAAGTLAENDIYHYTIDFENSLRGENPDEELYNKLADICIKVKKRITEQSEYSDAILKESGTVTEFLELMKSLKNAMQEYDPKDSTDVIKLLKEKLWPSTDELKLNVLYEFAEKYKFDAALDILSDVMEGKNE